MKKTTGFLLSLLLLIVVIMAQADEFLPLPESKREGWLWPVPDIYHYSQAYSYNGHGGFDIGGLVSDYGADVRAAKAGIVVKIFSGCNKGVNEGSQSCEALANVIHCNPTKTTEDGVSYEAPAYGYCNGGYGNGVVIYHEDIGVYSHYGHMKDVCVTLGPVQQGALLGHLGSSGYSSGPHLHFEIANKPVIHECIRYNNNPNTDDLIGDSDPEGISYITHITPSDTTPPVISNVVVSNVSTDGYTVSFSVSDNTGVTRIAFPTWTEANSQDDLNDSTWAYHNVSTGPDETKTFSYDVRISDHNNERGYYLTHIYAWDAAGNYAAVSDSNYASLRVKIPEPFNSWFNFSESDITATDAHLSADFSRKYDKLADALDILAGTSSEGDNEQTAYVFASTDINAVQEATPSSPGSAFFSKRGDCLITTNGDRRIYSFGRELYEMKDRFGVPMHRAADTTYYYKWVFDAYGTITASEIRSVQTSPLPAQWYSLKQDSYTEGGDIYAILIGYVKYPQSVYLTEAGVFYSADRSMVEQATVFSHDGVAHFCDYDANGLGSDPYQYDNNYRYSESFWRDNKIQLTQGITYYYKFYCIMNDGQAVYSDTATYVPAVVATTYNLTVTADEGGSVYAASGRYAAGNIIELAAEAAPGYAFTGWTCTAGSLTYPDFRWSSFTMPASDASVTAHFERQSYSLDVLSSVGEKVTDNHVDNSVEGYYHYGDQINLSVEIPEGLKFDGWYSSFGGTFENADNPQTKFTMPANLAWIVAQMSLAEGYHYLYIDVEAYTEQNGTIHKVGDRVYLENWGAYMDYWASDDVEIIDPDTDSAYFIMPDKDVTVTIVQTDLSRGWTDDPSKGCGAMRAEYKDDAGLWCSWLMVVPEAIEEIRIVYKLDKNGVVFLPPAETIEAGAFSGDTSIEYVVIDDNTRTIGDNAFANCSRLKSVVIPDTVDTISSTAFSNCECLTLLVTTDSPALIYAQNYHIPYVNIDEYGKD